MREQIRAILFFVALFSLLYILAFFVYVVWADMVFDLERERMEQLAAASEQEVIIKQIDFKKYRKYKDEFLKRITAVSGRHSLQQKASQNLK